MENMAKGHYEYVQVVTDEWGNIYDTKKYALCDLCKKIVIRSQLVPAVHALFSEQKISVCSTCYYTSPMVKRWMEEQEGSLGGEPNGKR